jgi:hypothetical protein
MKYLKRFNESVDSIDWNSIENKWEQWYYEISHGEADYDDEFAKMKKFLIASEPSARSEFNWSFITGDYYDYIEETNNESDPEDKFKEFKKIVLMNKK